MRLKHLAPLVLIFPITLIVFYYLIISNNPYLAPGGDFISYYSGASIIKEGKGPLLYDFVTQKEYFDKAIEPLIGEVLNRYIAPPFVAFLYFPFVFINFFVAYKMFTIINISLFLLFIYYLVNTFKNANKLNLFILALPFYFYPVIATLVRAQTSFILALLTLFLYKLIKARKSLLVGICTALLLMKPQYLVFTPFIYLLVNNKKKYLFGLVVTLLSLLVISLLITGLQGLIDYPSLVLATENPEFGNRAFQMFSLHGLVSGLFFNSDLSSTKALIINFLGFALAFSLFVKSYKKLSFDSSFIIMIFLSLLFSVHVLSHDLVLLLIPMFILLDAAYRNKKGRRNLFFAALTLFIIPATISLGSSLLGTVLFLITAVAISLRPRVAEVAIKMNRVKNRPKK